MKLIDLHCDTITQMANKKCEFTDTGKLHVSLPGLVSSNSALQVFACFVLGYNKAPEAFFEQCNAQISAIEALIEKYQQRLRLIVDAKGLSQICRKDDKTAVIIAIEGATPLKGRPEVLEHFYDRGVRLLTIAWDDNEFCGTVFGSKSGLTQKGRQLIGICNDLGVAVDVSHASDKAFYQINEISNKPFLASHSNARAVCPNDRNLTDAMIRIIAEKQGVIGLTFGSGFICPDYFQHEMKTRQIILDGFKKGTMTPDQAHDIHQKRMGDLKAAAMPLLVDHARHIIKIGGEDCLAMGSDFDGVESLVQTVKGIQSVPLIVQAMEHGKIPSRIIEKICFGNAYRFFTEVI